MVKIRLYAEYLEVWHGQKCLETIPRLRGPSGHHIQYRHIIDWLVRKPGAFENYRYRESIFPTSRFRMAYDSLRKTHSVSGAAKEYLKILHLSAMRECWLQEADLARKESLTYEQYLFELTERECEARRHARIVRLLRESRLPLEKGMETFDRKRLSTKLNAHIDVLIEGSFLGRAENVLAFGNPGSGKTHLLCAIALELVQKGRSVLFTPCSLLVQDLLIAKRELTLSKNLKKLARFDAIIIDDIGYVQQSRVEMEVLFTFLADRYERGTVMLTSNLPFSKWEQIFKDPMTTAAAIDRLVHHSIILELNLPSYRLEKSKLKINEEKTEENKP